VQVLVRDNNVDQALKALKKKMQREGIFREMKLRGHYEKPSEKKARERAEAIRATFKGLEAAGHKVIKVKNYWPRGDNYSGVNSVLETSDGLEWELQFHTAESFMNAVSIPPTRCTVTPGRESPASRAAPVSSRRR